VPGEGSVRTRVMVVGEGPGREEDATGRPFVGRAGRLLDDLLASVGLRREDLYITNALKDRAATARAPFRDRPPHASELAACAPWLAEQVAIIDPRLIVTLGRVALAAFLPAARIKDVHGRAQRLGARLVLPLYHPSYALHSPRMRRVLFEDIAAVRRLLPVVASRRTGGGCP
jgi:uracil-DNA glycosylase family 4